MSLNGSDRDRLGAGLSPTAFAELNRYLTLQPYLPKTGGLFGSGWARFMADRAAASPVSTPADLQQGIQQTPLSLRALGAEPGSNSSYQLAALSSPSRWPIPVPGCASCHGPSQPPVTPPAAPPRGWGTSSSRSGDDRKQ